jgi:hypothetical protein
MQIWTGKFCRFATYVVLTAGLCAGLLGCSSKDTAQPAGKDEVPSELGVSEDRKALDELRKNEPEEIKKSNDRLAEMLERWKYQKTPPERLRELFEDEIRKKRVEIERRHTKQREEFSRGQGQRRREFEQKQKEEREDFFSSKPSSEKRNDFRTKQSEERDRFNTDLRNERDELNDRIKDERQAFEDDIKNRWVEFRQEFPEYTRVYNEMKQTEDKKREELKAHPQPYAGWPYKDPSDQGDAAAGSAAGPSGQGAANGQPGQGNVNSDINKGGNGWPTSDMSEFQDMKKSGH